MELIVKSGGKAWKILMGPKEQRSTADNQCKRQRTGQLEPGDDVLNEGKDLLVSVRLRKAHSLLCSRQTSQERAGNLLAYRHVMLTARRKRRADNDTGQIQNNRTWQWYRIYIGVIPWCQGQANYRLITIRPWPDLGWWQQKMPRHDPDGRGVTPAHSLNEDWMTPTDQEQMQTSCEPAEIRGKKQEMQGRQPICLTITLGETNLKAVWLSERDRGMLTGLKQEIPDVNWIMSVEATPAPMWPPGRSAMSNRSESDASIPHFWIGLLKTQWKAEVKDIILKVFQRGEPKLAADWIG